MIWQECVSWYYSLPTLQLLEDCVLNMLVASCGAEEEHHFSDDEILSHCISFLIAAYDTTSVTLACATHLLATHTHVQDKLCSLLDEYWSQHQVEMHSVALKCLLLFTSTSLSVLSVHSRTPLIQPPNVRTPPPIGRMA